MLFIVLAILVVIAIPIIILMLRSASKKKIEKTVLPDGSRDVGKEELTREVRGIVEVLEKDGYQVEYTSDKLTLEPLIKLVR